MRKEEGGRRKEGCVVPPSPFLSPPSSETMRLFLAINLEPELRRAIVDATASLRAAAPTLSWVDAPRLHLTLKFLGDQPDTVPVPLEATLDDVAQRHRPFAM